MLYPRAVLPQFEGELHHPVVCLVGVVGERFALIGDELAVAVDVSAQDPAEIMAPQLSFGALQELARVDLRSESWHSRCCWCSRCGLVVGLACWCTIFRKMLELIVGNAELFVGARGMPVA